LSIFDDSDGNNEFSGLTCVENLVTIRDRKYFTKVPQKREAYLKKTAFFTSFLLTKQPQ